MSVEKAWRLDLVVRDLLSLSAPIFVVVAGFPNFDAIEHVAIATRVDIESVRALLGDERVLCVENLPIDLKDNLVAFDFDR